MSESGSGAAPVRHERHAEEERARADGDGIDRGDRDLRVGVVDERLSAVAAGPIDGLAGPWGNSRTVQRQNVPLPRGTSFVGENKGDVRGLWRRAGLTARWREEGFMLPF